MRRIGAEKFYSALLPYFLLELLYGIKNASWTLGIGYPTSIDKKTP